MADKENQHFVPQYYFRFFSADAKSISLLRTANGKTIATASIKGQSSKSYFYGDSNAESLITQIESQFINVLKKLRREKTTATLDPEENLLMLQSIIFQWSRTLSRRIHGQERNDFYARTSAEIALNKAKDINEELKDSLRPLLKYVKAEPIPFHGIEMAISITNAHYLDDLRKIVLKNRTKTPFIFSDAPSILINPMQEKVKDRGVLGMKTPGLIALLPLDSRTAVMLYDSHAYSIKGISKGSLNIRSQKDIDEINKLQIHNSSSSVYFGDFNFEAYVKGLWTEERKSFNSTPRGVVREGVLLEANKEKQIVHFFENQLPKMPKLSFIKYEKAEEHSYLIDRAFWNGKEYF